MTRKSKNQEIISEIFELYALHGNADYIGEPVSQLEHMSQSAELAIRSGYDDEVIIASFFHDIGHICVPSTGGNKMGGYGILRHEKVGADYLRKKGFPERVARLIENHVQAKRYLTFKNRDYYQSLSEASRKTLEFQGGVMSAPEAAEFEEDELFELSILLRKWDELAKEINVPIIDLNDLRKRALTILEKNTKKKASL